MASSPHNTEGALGNDMAVEIEKVIWESWLTAERNKRYWSEMARRYQRRERIGNIIVAVISSSAVASSWINHQEWLWKPLSLTAAAIAALLPILNYPEQLANMVDLVAKWRELERAYERLWFELPDLSSPSQIRDEFSKIRDTEKDISSLEAKLPSDKKLCDWCLAEVTSARKKSGY